jgi:hypothetical protein
MNSQPEDFDRLKKLLALKRHEQPPPGYFVGLSSRIMDRIEEERQFKQLPWYRKVATSFEWKPTVVWVTGMAACGLVCAGMIGALQVNNSAVAASTGSGQEVAAIETGMPPMAPEQEVQGSMEPVLTPTSEPSPFSQITHQIRPVNYTAGN